MAATGKTPILLYGSTTTSNVPAAGNLINSSDGCEIAINVADKNLFFKDSTNTVNTVPIRQSSASSNGWLSSTDWSTFNGKAPAVTYTTNYIPYGQGTTTPNQSANLVFDGTNLGVGISSPLQKLHVATAGNNYIVSNNTAATSSALLLGAEGAQNTIYSWSTVAGATGRPLAIYAGASEHSRFNTNGDYTVQNGNVVIGTSGKGIDFSVTAGTGTSELFADYEEGTWTPTGNGVTFSSATGKYTKVGNLVTVTFYVVWPTTSDTNTAQINGLPFTSAVYAGVALQGNTFATAFVNNPTTYITFVNTTNTAYLTNANVSTQGYIGCVSYQV